DSTEEMPILQQHHAATHEEDCDAAGSQRQDHSQDLFLPSTICFGSYATRQGPAGAGRLPPLGLWREADSDLRVDGPRHRRVHGPRTIFGVNPNMNGNLTEAFACPVKNFATVDCGHAGA